jgi:hypothetical protein
VDLGHRPVDPPLRPKRAPLGDEFASGLFQFVALGCHLLSIFTENSKPARKIFEKVIFLHFPGDECDTNRGWQFGKLRPLSL